MSFTMKHELGHFYPKITCDICGEEKMAKNLNFEHTWEGEKTRIVCKLCSGNKKNDRGEFICWMPMDAYIVAIDNNCEVDKESGNFYLDATDHSPNKKPRTNRGISA